MTKRSLNNQQAMNKKERLVAAIKNGTVTVSYTHLTLPTNSLV